MYQTARQDKQSLFLLSDILLPESFKEHLVNEASGNLVIRYRQGELHKSEQICITPCEDESMQKQIKQTDRACQRMIKRQRPKSKVELPDVDPQERTYLPSVQYDS